MKEIFIETIGGNCPVQAEGTIDGQPFYFRARGHSWEIEIEHGFVLDRQEGGFHYEEEYGAGPFDAGWMTESEARKFIEDAAEFYRIWKTV